MTDTQTAAQTSEQVNAMAVINGLTAEIARLTQRAIIAEARVADLEARIDAAPTTPKENA
jgi:hypothetical protein